MGTEGVSPLPYSFDLDRVDLAYDSSLGVGIGRWRPTGKLRAEIIVAYRNLAGYEDPDALDAMFAPDAIAAGHSFVPGCALEHYVVAIAAGGTTLTSIGEFEAQPEGSIGLRLDDIAGPEPAWSLSLRERMLRTSTTFDA